MTLNNETKDSLIKLIYAANHMADKIKIVEFEIAGIKTSAVGILHENDMSMFEALFINVNDDVYDNVKVSENAAFMSFLDNAEQISTRPS